MVNQMRIQEYDNERSQSALEKMLDGQHPRLIRDKFNQLSDILDKKPSLDIVQYLEIKDLLNSNKRVLNKDGKEDLTRYQTEKIEAYKRLDEHLNTFLGFEENIEPEVSDILSKKGSYRYWNKRIDAIESYVSSENANPDMVRYFSDYVDNAINSFIKKDGSLKARKDPDTFNKLKKLKKDITAIIYDKNNANKLNDSNNIITNNTETNTDRLEKTAENYGTSVEDAPLMKKENLDELLAGQTEMGIFKRFWRRFVDGAIGHLNGPYKVEDIYSKRTIEIAQSMAEYDLLQKFTIELNEHAKNSKEAIAYIKKNDAERGFLYTPDIKKIDLHSKYEIENSERREDKLFRVKDYFSPGIRLNFRLNGRSDELIALAGDFNSNYQRSRDDKRPKMDRRAELLSQIALYNETRKYGRIPKARFPKALI